MGIKSPPRGLPTSISDSSQSVRIPHCVFRKPESLSQGGQRQGDRGISTQRGNRTSARPINAWFLQLGLPCTQGARQVEIHHKPEAFEPVLSKIQIQNVNHQRTGLDTGERSLDNITRSKRRFPPYSNTPSQQEVPKVCPQGESSSIQGSSLRPVGQSICVYEGDQSCGTGGPESGSTATGLYRRLAEPRVSLRISRLQSPLVRNTMFKTGFAGQQRKIGAHSNSDSGFCGDLLGPDPGKDVPNKGAFPKHSVPVPPPVEQQEPSTRSVLVESTRSHDFNREACPLGQTLDATASIYHEESLQPVQRQLFQGQSPFRLRSCLFPEMVVQPGECTSREIPRRITCISPDVHRCIRLGLGSIDRPSRGEGSMGISSIRRAYQYQGAESSLVRPAVFSAPSLEPSCPGLLRQLYNSCLPEEPRGDNFMEHVLPHSTDSPLVQNKGNSDQMQIHSRKIEPQGRRSKQGRSGSSRIKRDPVNRMAAEPSHSSAVVAPSIPSFGRLVRHQQEQVSPSIFLTCERSRGTGNRCVISQLGGAGRIRIPSMEHAPCSDQETRKVSVPHVADSPHVDKDELVPNTVHAKHIPANKIASKKQSTCPRKGPVSCVPGRGGTRTSRLVFMRAAYERQKLKGPVIDRLLISKKASTTALYQSRWDAFLRWCLEQGYDESTAGIPEISEFLVVLFSRKQALSTIKGHLTAVVGTLNARGGIRLDAADPIFAEVIRSFKVERPLQSNKGLKWNLAMVLHALTKHPFEPNFESISIKLMSMKTLFLLLLASSKRRGNIYSLDATQVAFGRGMKNMSIGVLPGFVSKTEASATKPVDNSINIPAIINSGCDDNRLCPVRAVNKYLTATKHYRRGRRRLFLPLAPGKEDISADTLTGWVKNLIIKVYEECPDTQAILFHCLHETRSVSTTWAALNSVSMSSILSTAQWKSQNVFINHYLRDFTQTMGDMQKLGPIIVTGHQV